MNVYIIKFIIIFIVFVVLAMTLIYSFMRGRKSALMYSFMCYKSILFIYCSWSFMDFFRMEQRSIFVNILCYIPRSFVGAAFLIFCLIFSSSKGIIKRSHMLILLAEPIIFYVIYVTNDYHNIIYYVDSSGYSIEKPYYYVHNVIVVLYLIAGAVILFRYCLKMFGYRTRQSAVFIVATAAIMILDSGILVLQMILDTIPKLVLWIMGAVNILVSSVFLSVVTFKYRFLNIVTAFRKIVESMREGIFFVDSFNRIIYYNSSFIKMFSRNNQIQEDDDVDVFVQILKSSLISNEDSEEILHAISNEISCEVCGELAVNMDGVRHYAVNVKPTFNGTKHPVGRVVSFSDITEYKSLTMELTEKNMRLREHQSMVEELAITKERNRFARDAHDTIGHTMTKLITILEVCRAISKDDAMVSEKLDQALEISRNGLNEIRTTIAGLLPEKLESNNLKDSLKCLVSEFSDTGVNVDVSIDGEWRNIRKEHSKVIFRVCQEALTNSLRHGKAENVTIILQLIENRIMLYIFDDGIGCKNITKGMGLSSMEQRVKSLGGTIDYGSDGDKGFNIVVEFSL